MDILRIATAGSVDAGKSTLIGRLLYDTRSVTKDKLDAIELSSKRKGLGFVDLSLLTDGLIAEREQNITIDVAHIYFATDSRKYIIADSPGHFEYMRNMITGASNAEVFILLIDALVGTTEQTKRHLYIASLLQVSNLIVCINKMDAVNYNESTYNNLSSEIVLLANTIGFKGKLIFIPIAAKNGENITSATDTMKWYRGNTLLQYLEEIPVYQKDLSLPLRLQVQLPLSSATFYAGKVISGTIKKGQALKILPSLQTITIRSLIHSQKEVDIAIAGDSITIEPSENIIIERGSMITDRDEVLTIANNITGTISWLSEAPMNTGTTFILQHGVNTVDANITGILSLFDFTIMKEKPEVGVVGLNDIVKVNIRTNKPVTADPFRINPRNGAFILIDKTNNNTVAAGFIESVGNPV